MQAINEAFKSNNIKGFFLWAQTCAKNDDKKRDWDIIFVCGGKRYIVKSVDKDGDFRKGHYKLPLSDLEDKSIYGDKFFTDGDIKKVLKTSDDVTMQMLVDRTVKSNASCLVLLPSNCLNEIKSVLFINGDGTESIKKMIQKADERKEANQETKVTDAQAKIAEWRKLFDNIKKKYAEYKKKCGDKKAMEMTEAVNKLSENEQLVALFKKNVGDIDKRDIQSYLYAYLLDFEDSFGFLNWMKKDERFERLHDKFHCEEVKEGSEIKENDEKPLNEIDGGDELNEESLRAQASRMVSELRERMLKQDAKKIGQLISNLFDMEYIKKMFQNALISKQPEYIMEFFTEVTKNITRE